jgi:hypothetical protein
VTLVAWTPTWGDPPVEAFADWVQARGARLRFLMLDADGRPISGDWPASTPDQAVPSRIPGPAIGRVLRMSRSIWGASRSRPDDTFVFFETRSLMVGVFAAPRVRRIFYCTDVGQSGIVARAVQRAAIARSGLVVVTEPAKLSAWWLGAIPERTTVVRNAVPQSVAARLRDMRKERGRLRRELGIPADAVVAIHAGGLGPDFGTKEEVLAAETLPPEAIVVFMGTTPTYLHPSESSRVRLTGRVSRQDWQRWLAIADIGLAFWSGGLSMRGNDLSRWNTPISWNRLYWYLAAGLPIAGGGHPALRAFLEETGVGVGTSIVSVAAVALSIRSVLNGLEEYERAAKRAYDDGLNYDAQVADLARALNL